MKQIPKYLAGVLYLIPGLVLIGWVTNNTYLKSVIPGLSPMNPLVCICILIIATHILLYAYERPARKIVARLGGAFVIFVGVIMLAKYILGIDLHIDRVLFAHQLNANRLAPNTAFNLVLIGIAMQLMGRRQPIVRNILYGLLALNAFIAGISIVGYTYGVTYLFGIPGLNPMAIHTATCFLLIDMAYYFLSAGKIRWYITKSIVVTLMLGLIIEATASVVAQQGALASQKVEQRLVNIYQAQKTLNDYETSMVEAETGQRGYLLTGNTTYLAPYNTAIQQAVRMEASLNQAVKVSPNDTRMLLTDIRSNTGWKLSELALTIQLKRDGHDSQALALVKTNDGKKYLDAIQLDVDKISENFAVDLSQATSSQKNAYNRLSWVFSFATIFNVLFILVAVALIRSALRRQQEAQRQAEKNMQLISAARSKDEALLSSIGDGVFALDNKLRITLFNQAATDITGFTQEEAIGKKFDEILLFKLEDSDVDHSEFIYQAMSGKRSEMTNHTVLIHKDGSSIPVADSAAPIFNNSHHQHGIIVVFRDVGKERMLERAQDEFVSLTSHQLRTPLTAIRLFTELLTSPKTGTMNEKQTDYIDKIHVSTLRMISLVGDILNLSRIQLGELRIDPEMTDVVELINEMVAEIKPVADVRHTVVSVMKTDPSIPKILVDHDLLAQVIHNFLGNALRYTTPGKGKITIALTREATCYRITVTDNGIGIPKEAQSKLFQRFFRADNAVKVEGEGSGLGLYLVKMIMKNAGGTVGFHSSPGSLTSFYATIPLQGMKPKLGSKTITRNS